MSKKILLADDSVTIQKIVELTFEGEGFDLNVVADGNEALTQAEVSPPDIILADLTMPGLSGIELCRKVREHPDLGPIPVILLTNSFEEFNRSDGDEAGISAYVEKPFESQALIDQVRELLSGEALAEAAVPQPEELQPPADEVDFISEEPEEILVLDNVLEDEDDALAVALDEHAEDVSLLEEVSQELEAPAFEAEELAEEDPEAEEAVIEEEEATEAITEAPPLEEDEEPQEVPEPEFVVEFEEEPEELYELEKEPSPPAFTSMMDSTIEALGPLAEDEAEIEPPSEKDSEDVTVAVATAGVVLEELIGDAVRAYIDQLINQAVEQLAPTIIEKVVERLEASFPPIAEHIIREEIDKLKRGE